MVSDGLGEAWGDSWTKEGLHWSALLFTGYLFRLQL